MFFRPRMWFDLGRSDEMCPLDWCKQRISKLDPPRTAPVSRSPKYTPNVCRAHRSRKIASFH
jgi:hypothetical protein